MIAKCDGYILAAVDTLSFSQALMKRNIFCVPTNVTGQQAIDVVKKWLVDNPAKRNDTGPVVTYYAMKDAWPC